jgi:transcriptional regulator with XRE-family HTH domain
VSPKPHGGVGGRLRKDLESAQMSARGLARVLAGPAATNDDVERWRRYVVRWLSLKNGRGMSPANAELVADALGTSPDRYLSTQFSDREKILRELERLKARGRELREQLAQLPKP